VVGFDCTEMGRVRQGTFDCVTLLKLMHVISDVQTSGILLNRIQPKASWPETHDHRICIAAAHTDHPSSSGSVL
jgi:hypothetical protein